MSDIVGSPGFRDENFTAAGRRCLLPRDFEHVMAVLLSLRIRSSGNCEFDEDLIWVDLRPDDMFVNENCVCDLGGFVEVAANGFGDEVLNFFGRDSADCAGLLGPALQQR